MSNASLQRSVRRFFRRQAATRINIPGTSGNLYELYVYTLVCEAVKQAGLHLQLHTSLPGEFHFRCSPGMLNSRFSYYSFVGHSGATYEIRNGIEVHGHSMMRHESDLCILRSPGANSQPVGQYSELVLTLECKCYASASSLKSEVRKNLGMVQDWSRSAHASQTKGTPQGCIHCGLGFIPLFVTNVRKNQRYDIQQYLETYDLGPRFGIIPRTSEAKSFTNMLSQEFAKL